VFLGSRGSKRSKAFFGEGKNRTPRARCRQVFTEVGHTFRSREKLFGEREGINLPLGEGEEQSIKKKRISVQETGLRKSKVNKRPEARPKKKEEVHDYHRRVAKGEHSKKKEGRAKRKNKDRPQGYVVRKKSKFSNPPKKEVGRPWSGWGKPGRQLEAKKKRITPRARKSVGGAQKSLGGVKEESFPIKTYAARLTDIVQWLEHIGAKRWKKRLSGYRKTRNTSVRLLAGGEHQAQPSIASIS